MRKSTLWTLCKVSTRISLSMPHRPTRIYTFRLLWIFCFRNHYSIYPFLRWNVPAGLVCADSAGWSGRYITQMYIDAAAFWGILEKLCRHMPTVPKGSYAPDCLIYYSEYLRMFLEMDLHLLFSFRSWFQLCAILKLTSKVPIRLCLNIQVRPWEKGTNLSFVNSADHSVHPTVSLHLYRFW